jgi:hypothetical protein
VPSDLHEVIVELLRGACLVVVTTSRSVERWATGVLAEVIPRCGTWLVIGPQTTARVVDPVVAGRDPEAALLSALIHAGHDDVDLAPAIAKACSTLPAQRGILFHDLLVTRLSAAALTVLEAHMIKGYVWKSEFARTHRAEGRQEGRQDAFAEARQDALLAALSARDIATDDMQVAKIRACRELAVLDRWLRRAFAVTSAADVFADE